MKSKSSSPKGSGSLRVSKMRAKPSLMRVFIAFSRTGLSSSAFSMICANVDLPSTSLRIFIKSFDREAERWLTCVMPFAVLVKTVVLSIRWSRGEFFFGGGSQLAAGLPRTGPLSARSGFAGAIVCGNNGMNSGC